MKLPILGALALVAASLSAYAEDAKPATSHSNPSSPTDVKPLTPEQEQQAFFLQGFIFANRAEWATIVSEQELNDKELDSLLAGIRASLKGERPSFNAEEIIPGAQKLISDRIEAKAKRTAAKNEEFFAKIDADKSFTKSPSGLRYKILAPGEGAKPTDKSTVKCLYTGKLTDGKVFDSTASRNNEPTEFPLNGVIPAWTEALQLIAKGGKIQIFAPANLAYGEQGQGPIPGNSILEFEVELVDFK